MKCIDVLKILEKLYPVEKAEEWDNSGFLVGDSSGEVKKILVALDADDSVVEEAVKTGADMIITHHPMIFTSVSSVTSGTFTGRRIIKMIKNGIAYAACHTNYDKLTMADMNAEMLGLGNCTVLDVTDGTVPDGFGRVGEPEEECTAAEFAMRVKKAFELEDLRCYGDLGITVRKAAVCGGSGKSMVDKAIKAGAQVLVTGDIDHHTGLDAAAAGLVVMDAGHYGTEHCFVKDMSEILRKQLPGVEVIESSQKAPYVVL